MENNTQNPNQLKGIIPIIILAGLAWFFFGGGQEKMMQNEMDKIQQQVPAQMQRIENQVADDAVKQYEIAARQGDRMQMYVQAGMCAAGFLQAQDEPNYDKWKSKEDSLGAIIGIPKKYR